MSRDDELNQPIFSVWESFVDSLRGNGRVLVSREIELVSEPISDELLIQLDALHRNELIDGLPVLDIKVASWACRVLYVCCALVAQRQLEVSELDTMMAQHVADIDLEDVAVSLYSADIFFNLLPRLYQIVKLRSESDPLLDRLRELAYLFPFSAPELLEIEKVKPEIMSAIKSNEAIQNTFTDRVMAAEAWQWLECDEVRERVEVVIGNFRKEPKFTSIVKALDRAKAV